MSGIERDAKIMNRLIWAGMIFVGAVIVGLVAIKIFS